jgi:hypothetical protein
MPTRNNLHIPDDLLSAVNEAAGVAGGHFARLVAPAQTLDVVKEDDAPRSSLAMSVLKELYHGTQRNSGEEA